MLDLGPVGGRGRSGNDWNLTIKLRAVGVDDDPARGPREGHCEAALAAGGGTGDDS